MMSTALHLANNHISNASLMTTKHANSIITGTGQSTATAVVIQPVVNESQLLVLATTATESLGQPHTDTNATTSNVIEPMSPASSTSTTSVSPTSNQFISVSGKFLVLKKYFISKTYFKILILLTFLETYCFQV